MPRATPDLIGNEAGEMDAVERRIMALEFGRGDLDKRLQSVEETVETMASTESENRAKLAVLTTKLARLSKDFEKLSGDYQRFIISAALALGGIVVSIVRSKLGL